MFVSWEGVDEVGVYYLSLGVCEEPREIPCWTVDLMSYGLVVPLGMVEVVGEGVVGVLKVCGDIFFFLRSELSGLRRPTHPLQVCNLDTDQPSACQV